LCSCNPAIGGFGENIDAKAPPNAPPIFWPNDNNGYAGGVETVPIGGIVKGINGVTDTEGGAVDRRGVGVVGVGVVGAVVGAVVNGTPVNEGTNDVLC